MSRKILVRRRINYWSLQRHLLVKKIKAILAPKKSYFFFFFFAGRKMSSPAEQTLAVAASEEEAEQKVSDTDNSEQSQEWETMARAWLSSFPEAKAVSMDEVEAWIDSNFDFIPQGIKSMPRPDVCQRLIAIQNCMRFPNQVLIL